MPHFSILRDLVIVLAVSLTVVFALRRAGVPTIAALLLSGVVLGPGSLGLVREHESIEVVAEIGVAMLLFGIGLKLSLRELARLRTLILGAGGMQVGLTVLAGVVAATAFGYPAGQALFFGCLLALSSTAIVLKMFENRGETDAPQGRLGLSVLVFQDLAVVPMMLLLPVLGRTEGLSWGRAGVSLAWSFAMVAAIVVCARYLFPRMLEQVVRARSRELFVLATLLTVLGTAWLGSLAGLSLALGAFLAGIVVADSEYAQQVLAEIVPLRDAFGSLFFVSVGMLLDPAIWLHEPLATLGLGATVLVGKALIVAATALAFGFGVRVAVLAGLALAQIGEFSFILAGAGAAHGLIGGELMQRFLAVSVLTMLLTPFLGMLSPRLAARTESTPWLRRLLAVRPSRAGSDADEDAAALRDHVVLVGHGLNGRNVVRVLRERGIPYVMLELNPHTVREARERGEPALYGDAASPDVLAHAGIARARVLVVAIADPSATRQIVAVARSAAPHLKVLVRTRYVSEVDALYRLGADVVVPEEFETSLELAGAAMAAFGVPGRAVERDKVRIRQERYASLVAGGHAAPSVAPLGTLLTAADLDEVILDEGGPAHGRSLRDLDLRGRTGASVVAVARAGELTGNPPPDFVMRSGDVLWVWGQPEQTEAARDLLQGDAVQGSGPES